MKSDESSLDWVALLACEGIMPLRMLEGIHASQKKALVFAIEGVTSQAVMDQADEVMMVTLTRLGKVIKTCQRKNITQAVFAGRIPHRVIYDLKWYTLDLTTLFFLFSLKDKRADSILGKMANLFQSKGIFVLDSTTYLKKYLSQLGPLNRVKIDPDWLADIQLGKKVALELGALDVGQTVVIKKQAVVAVEAMEGTDACLERARQIAGPGCIVVKMAKPNQDMRFDVPVIGINTIEKLIKIKAHLLAIQADKTLIIDPDALALAEKNKIAIVGVE